jgi:Fur family zinc uptake transcriptional regulator
MAMLDAGLPAAPHAHVQPTGDALAEAARIALEAHDERWTELRATVFAALAGMGGPASAYDVADRVTARLGRRIAANSVYRILDLFVATRIAMRVESRNAYVANPHPGCEHDCIYLLCEGCGGADHLDDDALALTLRHLARQSGFLATRPVIEVIGRCALCTGGAAA